jgi:hypothetical protein
MNVLNPYGGVGRSSVRISSKKSWGTGSLVVVDLAHVPGGQCGTWPAMWLLGPNWPWGGEIDIIEGKILRCCKEAAFGGIGEWELMERTGVNSNTKNLMSLHT